jgi:predicted Fe-S protein YdhL (DUF1289 family)
VDLRHPGQAIGFTRRPRARRKEARVKSPCIKVCAVDPQRRVCLGCCRTLEEIAAWASMSEEERDAVMAILPARRKALEVPEHG